MYGAAPHVCGALLAESPSAEIAAALLSLPVTCEICSQSSPEAVAIEISPLSFTPHFADLAA